ncbi:PLP-dependent transferase [Trichodelitschia bisporula]|uniref:aromatic-amino-acid transaminase n=1 Tax=Trichodelitschia bisporula TaxID=703511 RepID=A0A6G1I7I0_9PEZI|nr:PLP-dependent transferase [Trichodelitschia bisporula]
MPPAATGPRDSSKSLASFSPPLRADDIVNRRRKVPKTQWGVAAPASSSTFKIASNLGSKPQSKRWDHLLSPEALSRHPSSVKSAAKYLSQPGLISLGGGLPSSNYFPFSQLTISVPPKGGPFADPSPTPHTTVTAGKNDQANGTSLADIATLFQYGQGTGSAQLLRWITEHTELVHDPPYADWGCTTTIGATSSLDMALRMFTQRGDMILGEEWTFASAVETAAPMGVRIVPIPMDAQGLLPVELDRVLAGWDERARGARKPRVLYTVPTGQNPTGATQLPTRRREVYRVCQKHDVYIFEDDPYYYLQMDGYVPGMAATEEAKPSHESFLASLIPSFLRIDTDGRVLRMDSFSKVLTPGARIGWVTASAQIIERYKLHADVSTQGASGISQLVLFKLLEDHWGHGGFVDWLIYLRKEYEGRRRTMMAACEALLPREVVSWTVPDAGMFLWLKIDHTKHPGAGEKSIAELEEEVFLGTIRHGALVMRGSLFQADRDSPLGALFFRTTFAAASEENIREAIRRFGEAIREVFGLEVGEAAGKQGILAVEV